MVRAGRSRSGGIRPRHRYRELGRVHPRRVRRARRVRLRPLAGRHGRRDGADRAVRSRRARGRRRGALCVRCRRDRHSRAPAHRSPQARRLRDDARGSDGGAAVDSGARRIGPPVGHDRPRRLDWRRRARTDGSVECGQRGADGPASRPARLAAGARPDAALVPRRGADLPDGPLSRPSRDWWRGSARPGGARAGAASRAGTAPDRSPDVGVRAVRDNTHHVPVCSSDTGDRASRLDHRAAWLVLRSIWPRRDGCATSWQSASSSRQS